MTIPRLMGPYDSAAENLQGLGKALRKIINPNYERQEFVKNKMLEDPTYAQTLADQEAESPGILKGMGLDDNTINTIIKRQQSPESVVKTKMRGVLNNVNLDDPDTRDALGDKFLGIDRLGREATRAGITATRTATARNQVGIEGDKIDNVIKQLQVDEGKVMNELLPLIKQGKTMEIQSTISNLQTNAQARQLMEKNRDAMKGKSLVEFRRQADPNEFAVMLANPQFSQLYEADWKSDLASKEARWQKELASLRISTTQKDFFAQQLQKRLADNTDALVDRGVNPQVAVAFFSLAPEQQEQLMQMQNRPEGTDGLLFDAATSYKALMTERVNAVKTQGGRGQFAKRLMEVQDMMNRANDPIDANKAAELLNQYSAVVFGDMNKLKFGQINVPRTGFDKKVLGVVSGDIGLATELGLEVAEDQRAKRVFDIINSGQGTLEEFLKNPAVDATLKQRVLMYRTKYELKSAVKPDAARRK